MGLRLLALCMHVELHYNTLIHVQILQNEIKLLFSCPQNLDLKTSLQMLVIDEADLVFSYGYEHDLKSLLR